MRRVFRKTKTAIRSPLVDYKTSFKVVIKSMTTAHHQSGFTLTELLVVITAIAILAVIAYPSYQGYLQKSRRADAKIALLDLANRLERFYADHDTYQTATIASGNTATDVLASADSPARYYTLSITAQTPTDYTLRATRKAGGLQAHDSRCGDLTLSSAGVKGSTGTAPVAECW